MYRYLVLVILLLLFENTMASCPAYDRRDYPHWIDLDQDCQNTRHEVLVEESTVPVQFKTNKKCRVVAGKWRDSFTGKKFNDPGKLDIDHLVPLKEAHQSGAYAWDQAKRKAFANELKDSEHLIAVAASANRSKGAKDPAEWLPPNKAFWKKYAQAWVNIKIRWNLKANAAELSRLKALLGADAELPQTAREHQCLSKSNKNSTMGLAVQANYECGTKKFCKEMKSCEEALFHLQQCKRKSLDRDQDGIPCEELCG